MHYLVHVYKISMAKPDASVQDFGKTSANSRFKLPTLLTTNSPLLILVEDDMTDRMTIQPKQKFVMHVLREILTKIEN